MHISVRRALQTALVTGGLVAAGAPMAHAEEPAGAAMLADTGWTPWLAFAGVCLVALGVVLRRVGDHPSVDEEPVHAPGAPRPGADPAGGDTRAVTGAAVGSAGDRSAGPDGGDRTRVACVMTEV